MSKEIVTLILEELTILDEYAQKISRLEGSKFDEMHHAIVERFNKKIDPIKLSTTSNQLRYILTEVYYKMSNKGLMYNEFFRDEIGLVEMLLETTRIIRK